MARDAHSDLRGATRDYYVWLEHMPAGALPAGPPVWICGDLHIGNIGPLADAPGGPGHDAGEAVAAVIEKSMRRRWGHLAMERLD